MAFDNDVQPELIILPPTPIADNAEEKQEILKLFMGTLPSDSKERKQHLNQLLKSISEEKRILKEMKKQSKIEKDGHCNPPHHGSHHPHPPHHGGHHPHPHPPHHGGHHPHPCPPHHGGHHPHPCPPHHGGHHPHPPHHGGHHPCPPHHGGQHPHPCPPHHGGHPSILKKIEYLNRKRQILIAKTRIVDAKINALTWLCCPPQPQPQPQPFYTNYAYPSYQQQQQPVFYGQQQIHSFNQIPTTPQQHQQVTSLIDGFQQL